MKIIKKIMENESMKLFVMLSEYFLTLLISYTFFKILKIKNCLLLVQIISGLLPVILYIIQNKKNYKKMIITIVSYFLIVIVLPFIFGRTYDLSVDGNSYHKTAIAFIKNGWNPIYEDSNDFQKNNDNIIKYSDESSIGLWIDHYPKGTWIIAATMYEMTGSIESGKSINVIYSLMLLIVAFNLVGVLLKNKILSGLIAILVTLNPIMITQVFTYYVDGLMGVCFAIELFLLLTINPMENQDKRIWTCLFSVCALFVNIKFTGLLYSGLIAAVFYFYWLIKYRKEKDFFKKFKTITIYFTIIFATSIFFIGSNSYVKNTIDHLNPLYPIIGKEKVDIITTMQPKSFEKKTMVEKFLISIFSKTENVTYYSNDPQLKLPFKLYQEEKDVLISPDVRIGGFGPFYALILIISTITLIPSLYLFIKNEKNNLKYIVIPLVTIIISMVLVGENWWARYVPQFYLIPIGSLTLLIYTNKYYKKQYINKALMVIVSILFMLNLYTFSTSVLRLMMSFRDIENDLKEMKNMDNLELKLGGMQDLYGYYYNLNDRNIKYRIVESIPDEESRYMYSWRLQTRIK